MGERGNVEEHVTEVACNGVDEDSTPDRTEAVHSQSPRMIRLIPNVVPAMLGAVLLLPKLTDWGILQPTAVLFCIWIMLYFFPWKDEHGRWSWACKMLSAVTVTTAIIYIAGMILADTLGKPFPVVVGAGEELVAGVWVASTAVWERHMKNAPQKLWEGYRAGSIRQCPPIRGSPGINCSNWGGSASSFRAYSVDGSKR